MVLCSCSFVVLCRDVMQERRFLQGEGVDRSRGLGGGVSPGTEARRANNKVT